jgi:hypothetical protein
MAEHIERPMDWEKIKWTPNPFPNPRAVRKRAMTVLNAAVRASVAKTLFLSSLDSIGMFIDAVARDLNERGKRHGPEKEQDIQDLVDLGQGRGEQHQGKGGGGTRKNARHEPLFHGTAQGHT